MTPGHGSKRSQQEDAAIIALLSEPTIAEAATKAGLGERTLMRWLAEPIFRSRYREARRQVVEHAVSQLQRAAGTAVETLTSIARDAAAPQAARVSAAKTILDQAFRGLETLDLVEEVAALKRQLVAGTAGSETDAA
jgi:hypothetical protein